MTPIHARVLDIIRRYTAAGAPPSLDQICGEMGWQAKSRAHRVVSMLKREGVVDWEPRRATPRRALTAGRGSGPNAGQPRDRREPRPSGPGPTAAAATRLDDVARSLDHADIWAIQAACIEPGDQGLERDHPRFGAAVAVEVDIGAVLSVVGEGLAGGHRTSEIRPS